MTTRIFSRSLGLLLFLGMPGAGSAWAANYANNCNPPVSSCTAACGTTCSFSICASPQNDTFTFNGLPFSYSLTTSDCASRLRTFSYSVLPTTAGVTQGAAPTIERIPWTGSLGSWACIDNQQRYGGCCDWNVGGWGGCSVNCGSGTRTRTVRCDAPNGDCCGSAPPSSEGCNNGDCAPQPNYCNFWCIYDGGGNWVGGPTGGTCGPMHQIENGCTAYPNTTASGAMEHVGDGGAVNLRDGTQFRCKVRLESQHTCP